MHAYRTHTCGQLRKSDVGQTVRLSGWVHRRRDHGGLIFIDLRDHYGITQCVIEPDSKVFATVDTARSEWVLTLTGQVVARTEDTVNKDLATGEVELRIEDVAVQSQAQELPLPVFGDMDYPEETRLTYRFLDLRRERLHKNIMLRSNIIRSLRNRMYAQGFNEFQTPILTASSPEGARDFLVPSRRYPGEFYALPQAPQQFKQLIQVAGFDRYFQIAPCFRDEDGRADRSPGEFYQLDMEMSFVTQDDVFAAIEPVLAGRVRGIRRRPRGGQGAISAHSLCRGDAEIRLRQAGSAQSDPDLPTSARYSRAPMSSSRPSRTRPCAPFPAPGAASQPRSFFDKLNEWARTEGAPGLGYIVLEAKDEWRRLPARAPSPNSFRPRRLPRWRSLPASKPATPCSSPPTRKSAPPPWRAWPAPASAAN